MSKPATQLEDVMDNIPYYDKWQLDEGIPIVKTFFVQRSKKSRTQTLGSHRRQRRFY